MVSTHNFGSQSLKLNRHRALDRVFRQLDFKSVLLLRNGRHGAIDFVDSRKDISVNPPHQRALAFL